MLELQIMML